MRKLRLSYTLMNLWQMGKVDEAISYYFKLERKTTEAMEQGIVVDRLIKQTIEKERRLPDFMGGVKLINPKPQLKIEISYNDYFDLVGVIDCYDEGRMFEFKTGKLTSMDYLKSYQTKLYSLLLTEKNYPLKEIFVIRFNQKENKSDWSKMFFREEINEQARNFIDSIAPEIYQFFKQKGLI